MLSSPAVGVCRAWSSVSPWAAKRRPSRCCSRNASSSSRSSRWGAACPGIGVLLEWCGTTIVRLERGQLLTTSGPALRSGGVTVVSLGSGRDTSGPLRRRPRLPLPAGQRLHAAGRLRPDHRPDRPPRRARTRRGLVQRAPLRRGRLPAVVRARRRRGRRAHQAHADLDEHLDRPVLAPAAPGRGPRHPRPAVGRAHRVRRRSRLRGARVQGVRLPGVAPRVAHRGVRRHPQAGLVRRALQLRRQALPVRRRAGDARSRAAGRAAAVDGGVERAERGPGGPLRRQRAAAGPGLVARRLAREVRRRRRRPGRSGSGSSAASS